jgi:PAS domain S-box-containing protein
MDAETVRKSRLLNLFLCLMLAVLGLTDVLSAMFRPGRVIPLGAYAFLISALLLNRFGLYAPAALLTLVMFPLVPLAAVLSGADPHVTFNYLIIGILASGLFLQRRGAIIFDTACFAFLVLTPILIPAYVPGWRIILGTTVLIAIGSGLSILLLVHRDEVESDRQAALRASEERLRLALDASHMGTWEWEAGSSDVRLSGEVEALFGLEPGDVKGAAAAYFRAVHPDDRAMVESAFSEAVTGKQADFDVLHRVIWPDGSIRWIQLQGRSTRGKASSRKVNGTVLDVTARKRAEAERDALIEELERKNAELERFTYTVSHDLKSPLITIRGFLGSIEKDIKESRFDRLGADVERIFAAAARMHRLLDELLSLSRIGRVANPPERVVFADLAREAMAVVRGRLDAARVRVDIAENLPDVHGDRSRLLQVLQNLLDNAAKFMGDQKEPVITIGTRSAASEGRPVFFVRDNGAGIAPADLEKVVGLFEKVDERSEGTGVGLAIVKRIVEVHGGKLWLESAGRGLGTTVCFTLPTRAAV